MLYDVYESSLTLSGPRITPFMISCQVYDSWSCFVIYYYIF